MAKGKLKEYHMKIENDIASPLKNDLSSLVSLYSASDWHRLQLGAVILRIKDKLEMDDGKVYNYILKTQKVSLEKLRDVKRCASAFEFFYKQEIPTNPEAQPPAGKLAGQNLWRPLATYCKPVAKKKREAQKETLKLVGEAIDMAFAIAKKDNRAVAYKDVKAALADSPLSKKDEGNVEQAKLRKDWLGVKERIGKFAMLSTKNALPISEEELSEVELAVDEIRDRVTPPEKHPPVWVDKLDHSFDDYWMRKLPCKPGLSNSFNQLLEPCLHGGIQKPKITICGKVFNWSPRNLRRYGDYLSGEYGEIAIDDNAQYVYDIKRNWNRKSDLESEVIPLMEKCRSLTFGGLCLCLENICRNDGVLPQDLGVPGVTEKLAHWDEQRQVWTVIDKPEEQDIPWGIPPMSRTTPRKKGSIDDRAAKIEIAHKNAVQGLQYAQQSGAPAEEIERLEKRVRFRLHAKTRADMVMQKHRDAKNKEMFGDQPPPF